MKVYVVVIYWHGKTEIKAVLSSKEEAEKLTEKLSKTYYIPGALFFEKVLDKIE
jgi:hypothetical protein